MHTATPKAPLLLMKLRASTPKRDAAFRDVITIIPFLTLFLEATKWGQRRHSLYAIKLSLGVQDRHFLLRSAATCRSPLAVAPGSQFALAPMSNWCTLLAKVMLVVTLFFRIVCTINNSSSYRDSIRYHFKVVSTIKIGAPRWPLRLFSLCLSHRTWDHFHGVVFC